MGSERMIFLKYADQIMHYRHHQSKLTRHNKNYIVIYIPIYQLGKKKNTDFSTVLIGVLPFLEHVSNQIHIYEWLSFTQLFKTKITLGKLLLSQFKLTHLYTYRRKFFYSDKILLL